MNWKGNLLVALGLAVACTQTARPVGPIGWLHDEAQAFAESKRTGKPILVNASADWCAACKLLDRNTWSDVRVQRAVRQRFIPLRIDLTAEGPTTDKLRESLGVEGLPTVLSCRPPACSAAEAHRSIGYMGPADMLVFLASQ